MRKHFRHFVEIVLGFGSKEKRSAVVRVWNYHKLKWCEVGLMDDRELMKQSMERYMKYLVFGVRYSRHKTMTFILKRSFTKRYRFTTISTPSLPEAVFQPSHIPTYLPRSCHHPHNPTNILTTYMYTRGCSGSGQRSGWSRWMSGR